MVSRACGLGVCGFGACGLGACGPGARGLGACVLEVRGFGARCLGARGPEAANAQNFQRFARIGVNATMRSIHSI